MLGSFVHRCLQCSGSFKPFTVKTEIQGGAKKDNYKILQYLFIYLFNLFVYLFVCLSIYLFIYDICGGVCRQEAQQ